VRYLVEYFDWWVGFGAIVIQFLLIKKLWWAPIAGLVYQPLWFFYIFITREWGFLPPTLLFTILYSYGIVKWKKDRDT
jgi:hypothetical protein